MMTSPNPLSDEAWLRWSSEGVILEASGALATVFALEADQLKGRQVWESLRVEARLVTSLRERTAQGPTVEFWGQQGSDPRTYLRVHAAREGADVVASVLSLSGLLQHAPPLQISRLSSALTHEIRNPLSSVKLAVQTLARNEGHSERDKRRLTIAHREIRTMERMLWLFSEYGRDTAPHYEKLLLRQLLQQAVEMVEPELKERQVALEVAERGGAPESLPVSADVGRIRPVLAQLLLNIAMGLAPGSSLKVALEDGPEGSRLLLEDPSSQLVPEERASLFEPFGSKLARGAGLSLAALRQVMLQQGGDVSAAPLPNVEHGTLFTLRFAPLS